MSGKDEPGARGSGEMGGARHSICTRNTCVSRASSRPGKMGADGQEREKAYLSWAMRCEPIVSVGLGMGEAGGSPIDACPRLDLKHQPKAGPPSLHLPGATPWTDATWEALHGRLVACRRTVRYRVPNSFAPSPFFSPRRVHGDAYSIAPAPAPDENFQPPVGQSNHGRPQASREVSVASSPRPQSARPLRNAATPQLNGTRHPPSCPRRKLKAHGETLDSHSAFEARSTCLPYFCFYHTSTLTMAVDRPFNITLTEARRRYTTLTPRARDDGRAATRQVPLIHFSLLKHRSNTTRSGTKKLEMRAACSGVSRFRALWPAALDWLLVALPLPALALRLTTHSPA